MNRCLVLLLVLGTAIGTHLAADPGTKDLADRFSSPPSAASPWLYWFWINGNISREGITADLEAMQRAGIGGALIMEVGQTKHPQSQMAPQGKVAFASPEWIELFAHALAEASRLGLEISLNNDAGWCGSGGPWNELEFSMQQLVWTEAEFTGPGKQTRTLPQPPSKRGFYRDLTVLAYPATPGPPVPKQKAKRRNQAKEELAGPPASPLPLARVLDLTSQMAASGEFAWDVPAGRWLVRRIGHTSTGRTNHPAPDSGLGLECDKFNQEAVRRHFAGLIGKLAAAAGPAAGQAFAMTHVDSWEVGEQDWTPAMPTEFRQRRGYALTPWLIPLTGGPPLDSVELTNRFRADFKRTQSELVSENYAGTLRQLASSHGLKLSIEPYGPDGGFLNPLDYGAAADLPMAEFWLRRNDAWHLISPRLLASVAHTTGKPIAGAESFTAAHRSATWSEHPYTLKSHGDWAFCEGINRLVIHRMVLQPWTGNEPGMTFGPFGTHFDRNQTWWESGAAYVKYLARCQSLLQEGRFVADVCRLVPDGENYGSRGTMSALPKQYAPLPDGYNYDYLSGKLLAEAFVKDQRIALPSGMSYALLQLPERDSLQPELMRKIQDLVADGATVSGPRPCRSPSLSNYPQSDEEVRELANLLWGPCDGKTVTQHPYRNGRVTWNASLAELLRELAGAPDLTFSVTPQPAGDAVASIPGRREQGTAREAAQLPGNGLNWIHRQFGQTDCYFLANPQFRPVEARCTFRIAGRQPEFWDPETGTIRQPATFVSTADTTTMPLSFTPAGSVFVVFRQPANPGLQVVAIARDQVCLFGKDSQSPDPLPAIWTDQGNNWLETTVPGSYRLELADGSAPAAVAVPAATPSLPLAGPWQVEFQPGRGAPATAEFPVLADWARHPLEGIRYFSGTATYSTSFDWQPADTPRPGCYLDLGRVEVIAELVVNGTSLGVLWKPPFSREVTHLLKPGRNQLRVRVTNLWTNRLIGDERYPDDCTADASWKVGAIPAWPDWFLAGRPRPEPRRITFSTWKYDTADTPLLPSGLLGPVVLRPAARLLVK